MKRNLLTITMTVFLFLCSQGIQAKVSVNIGDGLQTTLDQLELSNQFVGTWQHKVSNDTIEIWEVKRYENVLVGMGYKVIKGKKSFWFAQTVGFMSKQDKFKCFSVWANGWGNTFYASFISKNKWTGEWVKNFNPEEVTSRFEVVFETPMIMNITYFNSEGEKTGEYKWHKDK